MSSVFDSNEDLIEKLRWSPPSPMLTIDEPASVTEGPRRRPQVREADPFVIAPIANLTAGVGVLDSAGEMLVWIYILREWRMKHAKPVAVTNAGLAAWGVHRRTKYRALEKLEGAGLIHVENRGKKSPLVSVLHGR